MKITPQAEQYGLPHKEARELPPAEEFGSFYAGTTAGTMKRAGQPPIEESGYLQDMKENQKPLDPADEFWRGRMDAEHYAINPPDPKTNYHPFPNHDEWVRGQNPHYQRGFHSDLELGDDDLHRIESEGFR